MKRCSQCDFIYEDDQNLCDMDGHELVYEPTIEALQVIATKAAIRLPIQPANSRSGRPALFAGAAVLIGIVLFVGYSGFTSEYAPQSTKAPSTNLIDLPQSAPDPTSATPSASPTPSPNPSPRLEKTTVRPTIATPRARSTSLNRSTAPGPQTVRSQPTKANHKKESRMGGFLRKTGRILKRPFKF